MSTREIASHRVIKMAAVDSKCEELEHLDKCNHLAAKVLKTRIGTALRGSGVKRSVLMKFVVPCNLVLTVHNQLSYESKAINL